MAAANRGQLQPGLHADVTVFDPGEIGDLATFSQPHRLAAGVKFVFVNGEPVLWDGKPTSARPGLVL